MALRPLFPTPVYEATLSTDREFENFNGELEAACRMLAAEDTAGRTWSKAHGYGGYTSYASLNDLPRRASVFADLKSKLDRHARAFAQALAFDQVRPAASSAASIRQAASNSRLKFSNSRSVLSVAS